MGLRRFRFYGNSSYSDLAVSKFSTMCSLTFLLIEKGPPGIRWKQMIKHYG